MNILDTNLATSSGYESNTEGENQKTEITILRKKTKSKIAKKILLDYGVLGEKISDLILSISSDDETTDVSLNIKDINPIKSKREYQEDNSENMKHEITQLIIHIYTNVSANNIQFLNITNYERHVAKSLYKDKGYVHSAVKHLLLCLTKFIKDQFNKNKTEHEKLKGRIDQMKGYLDKIFKPVFENFQIKNVSIEYIINSVWKEVYGGLCNESLWNDIKKYFNLIKKKIKKKTIKEL